MSNIDIDLTSNTSRLVDTIHSSIFGYTMMRLLSFAIFVLLILLITSAILKRIEAHNEVMNNISIQLTKIEEDIRKYSASDSTLNTINNSLEEIGSELRNLNTNISK